MPLCAYRKPECEPKCEPDHKPECVTVHVAISVTVHIADDVTDRFTNADTADELLCSMQRLRLCSRARWHTL